MADTPEQCPLCDKPLPSAKGERKLLKNKSLKSAHAASIKRKDKRHLKLRDAPEGIEVHKNCAKTYTSSSKIEECLRRLEKEKQQFKSPHATRSSRTEITFDFVNLCFYCGKDASDDFVEKQRKKSPHRRAIVRHVTTDAVQKKVLDKCNTLNNELANEVRDRIERVEDLVAVEARYHDNCMKKFYSTNVNSPVEKISRTALVADFISKYVVDNKEEGQFCIRAILENFDGDKDVDIKYVKEHLIKKFGNDIIIHPSRDGHIITYLDAGAKILTEHWNKKQQKRANEEEERDKICKSAGKIISEDVRRKVYESETLTVSTNVVMDKINDGIPRTLKLMLDEAILKNNKRNPVKLESAIANAAKTIISAIRPRSVLVPILNQSAENSSESDQHMQEAKRAKLD